jgi:hypothetical protein
VCFDSLIIKHLTFDLQGNEKSSGARLQPILQAKMLRGVKPMKFFREIEPGIFRADRALQTERDGEDWTREYDALLDLGQPFAVIANVVGRPRPPAGKPLVLWMKARKEKLAALVKLSVYIAGDAVERSALEDGLPKRAKASPYPMAVAASEADAISKARASLS